MTSPRPGCNLGLLENLFAESSSSLEPWLVGTFSTNESSSWWEPWLVGTPFRCYKQLEESSLKKFSNKKGFDQLEEKVFQQARGLLGLLENLFNASSSGLEPLMVGTFSPNESSSWLELLGKPFRRGCNQLEDSTSKRFSKQLKLQLARGLIVEKIFQPAKVGTRSRSRRRKGFQISLCYNQLEESSLKKFSNQVRFRAAWGKGFPTS